MQSTLCLEKFPQNSSHIKSTTEKAKRKRWISKGWILSPSPEEKKNSMYSTRRGSSFHYNGPLVSEASSVHEVQRAGGGRGII